MKTITILILIAISLTSIAQDSYKINVEIAELRNSEGEIHVEVYNKEKEVIKTLIVDIENKKCNFEITDLPKGEYAIRYFHDENKDNEINMKWDMIPTEGFGYSNNATGMFGEPDFEDWLFILDENKSLLLKIYYLY